nr:hypothetical protein [Tanacetum cinerariifolium]
MSAKRTAWNEFSSSMALAVICLATVNDLSSYNTKYTSPALIQKAVEDAAKDEDDDNEVSAEPTPPSPTLATPPPSPTQEHIPSPPQAQTTQPTSPSTQHPSQTVDISQSAMTLLNTLLETCATLTKQVANLEQDKISQAIEITKLKEIVELDADEDVTLVDSEEDMNANVQGRLAESQAKHYNSIQAFLEEGEKEIEEEGNKRKGDSLNQDEAKKQRIDEDAKELKRYLQIINTDDDDMILLVEKKYPLTHFTLEQMLNNVRIKVKEESEMSLELPRLMRRQLQEGYIPE